MELVWKEPVEFTGEMEIVIAKPVAYMGIKQAETELNGLSASGEKVTSETVVKL